MTLYAKAAAEGLYVPAVKKAILSACKDQIKHLGYSKPTKTVLKCHELAALIGNDCQRIFGNDGLGQALSCLGDNLLTDEILVKKRQHENTQTLFGCAFKTEFWYENKKYVKLGSVWHHVSTYHPTEKANAEQALKTKGFFTYKGLRHDVAKKLNADLSSTLNEMLDDLLK